MSNKTFSRDEVAEWAGLTRPQLNHFHKIGLCVSDVGDVRKRISRQEAVLTASVAAFVRLGVQPQHLIDPFDWLRKQLETNDVIIGDWKTAVDGLPKDHFASITDDPVEQAKLWDAASKDFWFSVYADGTEWKTEVGRTVTSIEGKEGFVTINVRTVVANRSELDGQAMTTSIDDIEQACASIIKPFVVIKNHDQRQYHVERMARGIKYEIARMNGLNSIVTWNLLPSNVAREVYPDLEGTYAVQDLSARWKYAIFGNGTYPIFTNNPALITNKCGHEISDTTECIAAIGDPVTYVFRLDSVAEKVARLIADQMKNGGEA